MSPQVWFQNRRAKTKQQAKKAEAAATANGSSTDATASNSTDALTTSGDADEDDDPKGEDAPSPALAPPPMPPQSSEESSPETTATSAHPDPLLVNANESEPSNSTSDSRRGSLAHPHPSPSWAASSPSVASANAPHPPPAASSSPLAGSSPSAHVNAHVRLSTHPPSATTPSHSHLAPTDLYNQRRTSLPVASLSSALGHGPGRMGLPRRGGFDPSIRRRSIDNRMIAHPYMHVAANANGQAGHSSLLEGDESAPHSVNVNRRPTLLARSTAPVQMLPGLHAHSMPIVPSQGRPQFPHQRQYDISPIPVGISSHSPMYNGAPGQGYDLFAPRHSIDGSALGLMQAHAQMNMDMHGADAQMNGGMGGSDSYSMGMGIGPQDNRPYAISQRSIAPPVPGPLPSPNFSFGNPFVPGARASNSSSDSGTASPSLMSLPRRASEGGASDADTEESSAGQLSRFGSVASLGGSEVSWTSAYTSEGGEDISASRRESW